MFSLAALRYRSVSVPGRGPISRFESGEFPVFGRRLFQVNAWLAPGHVPDRPLSIYSNADGTGAHPQLSVARHMAVSEALERWAYHTVVHSAQGGDFGFDRDRSSNGMAAFPGLTSKPARPATKEAAPAPVSPGLVLDGCRQMVFNPAASHKISNNKKKDVHTHPSMGDSKWLLSPTE